MALTINGKTYAAKEFAYDGCHKIYLIDGPEDRALMEGYGYNEDRDILPVSELAQVWEDTCPLRFISRADLKGPDIVAQGDDEPVIEYTADEGESA